MSLLLLMHMGMNLEIYYSINFSCIYVGFPGTAVVVFL